MLAVRIKFAAAKCDNLVVTNPDFEMIDGLASRIIKRVEGTFASGFVMPVLN